MCCFYIAFLYQLVFRVPPHCSPVENTSSGKSKRSPAKPTGKKGSKKKDKNAKAQDAEKEPEMEEEPQVDPCNDQHNESKWKSEE